MANAVDVLDARPTPWVALPPIDVDVEIPLAVPTAVKSAPPTAVVVDVPAA
jgi:hypothetical protein